MATIKNVLLHSLGIPMEVYSLQLKIPSRYGVLQRNMDLIEPHNSKDTITM